MALDANGAPSVRMASFDAAPMTGAIFAIEVGIKGLPEPVFG